MLKEPYSAAQFFLEFDGEGDKSEQVGFCRSVEGGGVKADILTYRQVSQGQSSFARQLAAKPKFEDIKLQVGMSMSESFYDWIEDFFSGGGGTSGDYVRKSGSIVSGDFHYRERYRRNFFDALISEVAIPKLDASDRNAAYMGVTIVPEAIEFESGGGEIKEVANATQKLWTPNNFSFEFEGFADALKRVTRIDGFTVKQQILEYHAGFGHPGSGGAIIHTGPGVIRVPGMIEFPNVAIYVPETDAKPLVDHFHTYGIRHQTEQARKDGSIGFMGHDDTELCSIKMEGVDIASIVPDRADSTTHDVKQVKVEFTCEKMSFVYGAGAA